MSSEFRVADDPLDKLRSSRSLSTDHCPLTTEDQSMASNRHARMQERHLMHFSRSMLAGSLHPPVHRLRRAHLEAASALGALLLVHPELDEIHTHPRRAFMPQDVRLVLVPVVADGREHRVGRRLAQTTQRPRFDVLGQYLRAGPDPRWCPAPWRSWSRSPTCSSFPGGTDTLAA